MINTTVNLHAASWLGYAFQECMGAFIQWKIEKVTVLYCKNAVTNDLV